MIVTKKMLLALTLIGALVGAGIGALATRTATTTSASDTSYNTTAQPASYNARTPELMTAENAPYGPQYGPQFNTVAEQTAYRQGLDAGYAACGTENRNYSPASTTRSTYRAPRRSSTRRVYYDYGTQQPKGRSFWSKHRDKLTLAIGTGAGAGVGALIGGKKGAGIGALAGLGGSALYTYKLRKRSRNY